MPKPIMYVTDTEQLCSTQSSMVVIDTACCRLSAWLRGFGRCISEAFHWVSYDNQSEIQSVGTFTLSISPMVSILPSSLINILLLESVASLA